MKTDLMLVMGGGKPPGEAGEHAGCCMTVPVSALTVPDEQDQPSAPAVGDRVSYQVDGVVESVNGEQAEVRATAINGTPLAAAGSEKPAEENGDSELADFKNAATKQGEL